MQARCGVPMTAYCCALALLGVCLWGSLVSLHTVVQATVVQARCAAVQQSERLERLWAESE